MANEVFVNDREVACKAGEGKSVASFPDVCYTPPRTQGSPRGIPVPYPNTAYAKDTANGSKTVMITGKQVALKDKSYFKTSTGNEAGCADKGIKTGKIKGKAYFTSWSMNVFIESYNVCRHMDMMTHNHGSYPPNTGAWPFLDSTNYKKCKKELAKVDLKCNPDDKKNKPKKTKKGISKRKPGIWKDKNCKGLGIKPNLFKDPEEVKKQLNDMLDVSKQLETMVETAKDKLVGKIGVWGAKKAAKIATKAGLKGWIGPAGWLWTAYDFVSAGIELDSMWDIVDDMKEDLENLKKLPQELENIKDKIKDKPAEAMADAQALIAKANPCTRAMKCRLVSKSSADRSKTNVKNGCCSGQTGHHLIPNTMVKNSADCKGVTYGTAPTVCAEGTSHSTGGSHGQLHKKIEKLIKDNADTNGEMTLEKAKDIAVKSHRQVFGAGCSKKCLMAQLDKYYDDKCKNGDASKVDANSAMGGRQGPYKKKIGSGTF